MKKRSNLVESFPIQPNFHGESVVVAVDQVENAIHVTVGASSPEGDPWIGDCLSFEPHNLAPLIRLLQILRARMEELGICPGDPAWAEGHPPFFPDAEVDWELFRGSSPW